MTAPETPKRPNSGEGKDEYKEFIKKLETEGRVELGNFSTELLTKYGTLNLAVWKGDLIKIRSGGFEIILKNNNVEVYREKRVEVNGKIVFVFEDPPIHVYVSGCLVKNIKELLFKLLEEYNYKVDNNKWVTVKLPRSNVEVRKLQSWLLATIYGFNRPLRDSPLNC
jgi:hypothetical protein